MIVRLSKQPLWKSLWASGPQVGMGIIMREVVRVGPGGSGVGAAIKPNTTGSSHS